MLLGLAAMSVSACSVKPATRQAVFDDSNPDPLARYRLLSSASVAQWATHVNVAVLQRDPQILALSSGAEDGAFGAGALCGWSAKGGRPQFDVVTGVSTGALIAPFAFLGTSQDETLAQIFVDHDASDIMRFNGTSLVEGGALYDSTPLAKLIATYTPDPVLAQIAARHDAGGRLFVVTSNLETSQAVIWNMGEIARAGRYDLFRAVLRASSALPGLFSPVTLTYSARGQTYREVHVDGGVHMQLLGAPDAAYQLPARKGGGGHAYVLINNTLNPKPEPASQSALGISQQALTTMVRAAAASELRATRGLAKRQKLAFSQACIEPDSGVVYDPNDRFSHDYMLGLFRYGFMRAQERRLWKS
jgi:hypothetical protein